MMGQDEHVLKGTVLSRSNRFDFGEFYLMTKRSNLEFLINGALFKFCARNGLKAVIREFVQFSQAIKQGKEWTTTSLWSLLNCQI